MSVSVIVVDFGGQYNQLIARRVRECHVYSEIVPYTKALDVIKAKRPRGIIFTGGPNSAYEDGAPAISTEVFDLGIPVLGWAAMCVKHLCVNTAKQRCLSILRPSSSRIFHPAQYAG